ncbi:MAG: aminoglycoside phosphotransferase family protein [Chloroflexi bacterium]|nr:MAG: aminoglycoside phosphotransferase family protein [Chloroflexota bacterium]
MDRIDPAVLVDLVLAHLDARRESVRLTPVTTGRHNRSYRVDCSQGRFLLRIAPPDEAGFLFYERRMMRQEPELHALVRAHTDIPVAEIVGYDFSRTRIDRDYLLMSWLPGKPLSEAVGLSPGQFQDVLRQVGQYLRQLHALTAGDCLGREAYGYLGAHQPMEPQSTWAAAFAVMWNRLIDDVVACGSYTPREAQLMRDLLALYLDYFDRPVAASLLHMDVWSQNILVDGTGRVTGLVDFDRALWGDVEIEFAVLDYCGISEPAFWEGYGQPRDESPAAMIRRQFYLLYEIQKYMPIRVWRRNDPLGAEMYKQHSFTLAMQLVPEE